MSDALRSTRSACSKACGPSATTASTAASFKPSTAQGTGGLRPSGATAAASSANEAACTDTTGVVVASSASSWAPPGLPHPATTSPSSSTVNAVGGNGTYPPSAAGPRAGSRQPATLSSSPDETANRWHTRGLRQRRCVALYKLLPKAESGVGIVPSRTTSKTPRVGPTLVALRPTNLSTVYVAPAQPWSYDPESSRSKHASDPDGAGVGRPLAGEGGSAGDDGDGPGVGAGDALGDTVPHAAAMHAASSKAPDSRTRPSANV
mmetsp:Transcript_10170/g.41186  ORF Transcript_10170/g.41186 Transcript_10170/m.41186 type:complete len:263 (+) Transcript_10170:2738-3526(+)